MHRKYHMERYLDYFVRALHEVKTTLCKSLPKLFNSIPLSPFFKHVAFTRRSPDGFSQRAPLPLSPSLLPPLPTSYATLPPLLHHHAAVPDSFSGAAARRSASTTPSGPPPFVAFHEGRQTCSSQSWISWKEKDQEGCGRLWGWTSEGASSSSSPCCMNLTWTNYSLSLPSILIHFRFVMCH